jgi:hypothetical protein
MLVAELAQRAGLGHMERFFMTAANPNYAIVAHIDT